MEDKRRMKAARRGGVQDCGLWVNSYGEEIGKLEDSPGNARHFLVLFSILERPNQLHYSAGELIVKHF
jgi:hypothetical protein